MNWPMSHWQPIETAPTDNARPLYLAVLNEDGSIQTMDYDGCWDWINEEEGYPGFYGWCSAGGLVEEPTHWAYQHEPPEALDAST